MGWPPFGRCLLAVLVCLSYHVAVLHADLPAGWATGVIGGKPYYYQFSDPTNIVWEPPVSGVPEEPPAAPAQPPQAPNTGTLSAEMPSAETPSTAGDPARRRRPAPAPTPSPVTRDPNIGLRLACAQGFDKIAESLIAKEGANVHSQDERGYACLHIAASLGHSDVVRLLLGKFKLRHSKRLNQPTVDGNTALHLAAGNNWASTVRLLLVGGAHIVVASVGDLPALGNLG